MRVACRPNDQYLTLAVYCLYDEWTATDRPDHLLHALTLLEHGITLSPSNFYFKLAAIHIYNLLGETALRPSRRAGV